MKVRFYRGPFHGKTREVRDDQHTVTVSYMRDNSVRPFDYTDPMSLMNMGTTTYSKTRHTHPDGSVYFEWDKPRGSRL